jgi:iron complex transport system substrate-binding protein
MFKARNLFPALAFALVIAQAPHAAAAPKVPTRIISLSPSATEDLFAIGAGKQVIAVDDLSNYPKSAPLTKLSAFNPNVEALAKYKPDLVVIQSTATKADSVIKQLRNLKIRVFVERTPNTLSEAYGEISQLGALTGKQKQAAILITSMKKSIAQSITQGQIQKSANFFHELDNTLYSATSNTFIGKVYKDFNLTNIADVASTADDGGYPQLQNEYIIKSDPQFIFLSDGEYGENPKTVSSRPGWAGIAAVVSNKIIILPADIPSRWGPRLVNFYQFISTAITTK